MNRPPLPRAQAVILQPALQRLRQRAFMVGAAGLLLCLIGWFLDPTQFFRSYLMGYLFCMGLTLGCLAIMMLQYLTGGAWGLVIRPLLESAARTLPLLALLFLPLTLGLGRLYIWARPEAVAGSALLQHKALYLNVPFFLVRAFFYFVVWMALTYFLIKWRYELEQTPDPRLERRLRRLSGPGLVLYGLTVTFASIDWIMSLEPEWFSSIYGLLIIGGQGLSALSFIIVAAVWLARRAPMAQIITPDHFHDLGKLLLAFVMLWAYLAVSQLIIIWSGNLPEEIPWYLRRLRGGWAWVGVLLILFHFALPFLLLLSRDLKRRAGLLGAIAGGIVFMRLVDLFWLTAPEFYHGHFHIHWLDFIAPAALIGLWLAFFSWQLRPSNAG